MAEIPLCQGVTNRFWHPDEQMEGTGVRSGFLTRRALGKKIVPVTI